MSMAWLLNKIKHIHSHSAPQPEYPLGTEKIINGVPSIYCKAGQDIKCKMPPCPRCGEEDNLISDNGRIICGYCHLRYEV